MITELDIFQLGRVLKQIDRENEIEIMAKIDLSGGWLTITGEAEIKKTPLKSIGGLGKSTNVIDIEVLNGNDGGSLVKLIGAKDKKFKIEVASTKLRNLSPKFGSNDIYINEEETKLKIDNDIIFKVPCKKEIIENVINNIIK